MATSVIFWNLEVGKSGNCLELTDFDQFQCIGYFSHSLFVTELDFELKISKFKYFWNLSRNFLEIWKFSRICCFGPIPTYWVSFPLNFSHWNWFWSQNFKIQIFLSSFQEFSGNLGILQNLLFCAKSKILGIIPTHFLSLNLVLNSEYQNSSFPKIFPEFSGNLEFLWISFFWANFWILIIFSTQFCSLRSILA